ncbi:hypothetical protein BLAT2472_10900 [Burkholderia latens]
MRPAARRRRSKVAGGIFRRLRAFMRIIDDDAMTRMLGVENAGARRLSRRGSGGAGRRHRRVPAASPRGRAARCREMPGGDGFDGCRALRALPEGHRVPIVMLTGE